MATYDLTTTTPAQLEKGDILNCPYSGEAKSITLPKGIYQLEVWGARGGRGPDGSGASATSYLVYGRGGYAKGTITFPSKNTAVHLYSGGAGADVTALKAAGYAGGFNGGGSGGSLQYTSSGTNGAGGGGASDIRIGSTSLYARVLVAGGGGGASWISSAASAQYGGAGGGPSGVAASYGGSQNTSYFTVAQPGTQTSGGDGGKVSSSSYGVAGNSGSFGSGGAGPSNTSSVVNSGAGGGGGWYGGGSGFAAKSGNQGHAAGGSGYVYTEDSASNYPEGCLLNSAYYLSDVSLVAGNTSIVLPDGSSGAGVDDNGYVRVTVLEILPLVGTPENFRTVSVSPDSITIAWDAAENAVGYTVYRNGVRITKQTAVTYTDTGLSYLTNYNYSVVAYDADENESDAVLITATTTYLPPAAPTGLQLYGGVQTALALMWSASDEQVEYVLTRDGTEVYRGNNLSYIDHGLSAGTTHVYQLSASTKWGETPGPSVEGTTKTAIELITDRVAADVAAGRPKGRYNALDLIRVGEAIQYAKRRMNDDAGYNLSVSPKLDWQLDDIPTIAQMQRYLTDVQTIRNAVAKSRETVAVPGGMSGLTWTLANDIERILKDAETLVHDILLSAQRYSGRTISGGVPLP